MNIHRVISMFVVLVYFRATRVNK